MDRYEPVVVGVDGAGPGWVLVALRGGRFESARWVGGIGAVLAACPEACVIGIDIPIGLPEAGTRAADLEAQRFLGARRSSVFVVPSSAVLVAASYAEAREAARRMKEPGPSAQAYALRRKILEVAEDAAKDDRIVEVHPEVSFRAMAGADLRFGKKTWNGVGERRRLLSAHGIEIPETLPDVTRGTVDDVVDAAAAAWTADRVARGVAATLPTAPPVDRGGRRMAIWY